MKKYEQREQQIADLQKEVDRLKKEEEENKLPKSFARERAIAYLKNGDSEDLRTAFEWHYSPQGSMYWYKVYRRFEDLTDQDIIQIQKWIILSFQQESNNN